MASDVQVTHSVVSSECIKRWLAANYDLGSIYLCRLISDGGSDTYEVSAETGHFVARLSPADKTIERQLRYEFALLDHLASRGVRVCRPISSLNGKRAVSLLAPEGSRSLALFPWAPGSQIELIPSNWRALGHAPASMHCASLDFVYDEESPDHDLDCLIDRPLAAIGRWVGSLKDQFDSIGCWVKSEIGARDLVWGACHGDAWANLSVDDEGNGTLFDFEHCGPGWLAYDIAVVKWGLRYDFAGFNAELWSAFLSGYSCVRELTDHELESIPVFVVARSIWKIGQLIANADRWGHRALTPQYFSRALRSITDAAKEAGYAEPGSKTLGDSST